MNNNNNNNNNNKSSNNNPRSSFTLEEVKKIGNWKSSQWQEYKCSETKIDN